MCGRFTLIIKDSEIASAFSVQTPKMSLPRYNIAPTNPIPFIFYDEETQTRECVQGEWGLVPNWSKNPFAQTARFVNARSETIKEKSSFKDLFKFQRCLIPASGFYEWKTLPNHSKQPYYFYIKDVDFFCFAGLWEMTSISSEQMKFTVTIITTEANEEIQPYHSRMPVIIDPVYYPDWLGENADPTIDLQDLLRTRNINNLICHAVDRHVNSSQFDHPSCIKPFDDFVI